MLQRAFSKLDFFVVQDIFFSHTCRFADVVLPGASESREGRHVHQHGAAHPEALRGLRAARWLPPGLANHPGHGEPARRGLELSSTLPKSWRNRLSDAVIRRSELRTGWKDTSRCNGRLPPTERDQPCFIPKHSHFPDGKARLYPVAWTEATGPARRGISICI